MNKQHKVLLFFSWVMFFSGTAVLAQKQTGKPAGTANTQPMKLSTINDTLQYAIGSFLAQWVNNQGFIINNPNLFIKGMDDIFQNKPRAIPDSVISPLITAYQKLTQKDRAFKLEQQLFTNIKQRPGLGIFPNGVHYFILRSGQGVRPLATDSVVVHLKGAMADGAVFEDTYTQNAPQIILLSQLIPGLSDAIQQMPIGSKWQLYVPSVLAHGDKGVPGNNGVYLIPPGSALIYEVELLEIRPVKK
jgi:FKBP-type peptidyl-prolyl cis-trans isomerase FklB